MAKRRKHGRRRQSYGSLVTIPAFGRLDLKKLNPFKTVGLGDAALGVAAGLGGGIALKMVLAKVAPGSTSPVVKFLNDYSMSIGALLGGVAVGVALKKPAMATAAGVVALVPLAQVGLRTVAPQYADLVSVSLAGYGGGGYYGGTIINDPQMQGYSGTIINDPQLAGFLGAHDPDMDTLAGIAMGEAGEADPESLTDLFG